MDLSLIIIEFVSKYPVLGSIIAVVGVMRLIFKPLMVFLKQVVDSTPTAKDNELLVRIESSSIFKTIEFLLDYLGSIKLDPKK